RHTRFSRDWSSDVCSSDLEFQEAAQLLGDTTPPQPDPETGLAWSIGDMAWYPISTGMATLEALSGHLQRNRPRELSGANHRDMRSEERRVGKEGAARGAGG